MQQVAYNFIKENISQGKWENDLRLVEQDISNELAISRTPIREAINSLILEGYLTKEANRGVIVNKQTISEKEFVERTQLLELLLSNYLFQLQIKQVQLPTEEIVNLLGELQNMETLDQKKVALKKTMIVFLKPLENQIIKQLIIKNIEQIHLVEFPNVSLDFLYDEIKLCLKNICQHVESKTYDLARKDIRVFFNRINLELIDQQI